MRYYIPGSRVLDLSAALLALSRPASVRMPGEVTTMACACEKDLKGEWWLVLDDTRKMFVHPKAELGEIQAILQPLIDAKVLRVDTLEVLSIKLNSTRGKQLTLWDVIPLEIKANAKTYQEMLDDNRLTETTKLP